MLLSKITQLMYCSLPNVPSVLQGIMLEYFGSFYEIELMEHMESITETMWTNWTRPSPDNAHAFEQEETKQPNNNTSSSSSLYSRLQESIKYLVPTNNFGGFGVVGVTGPGMTGPTGFYNSERPIFVSAEDAKLFFIYHPQLKNVLIYHEALDIFLIPYNYSRFYLLQNFFLQLNMFVAIPNLNSGNPGKRVSFRIAVSLT